MISRIALRRIVGHHRAEDPAYDQEMSRICPAIEAMKDVSDAELLQRLKDRGIEVDKNWMDEATRKYNTAFQIANHFGPPSKESEMIWMWLDTLWQRWFPDHPSFEWIEEGMSSGYDEPDPVIQCHVWHLTWNCILRRMEQLSCSTLEEFDERFEGSQAVCDWLQDYETELLNTSRKSPEIAQQRIEVCERVIDGLSTNPRFVEHFQQSLADVHFELGNLDHATALYEKWLADDPRWGWGWVGWSDQYFMFSPATVEKTPDLALEILQRGLDVPDVRDRNDILDRMATVLKDLGRDQEAQTYRDQITRKAPTSHDFHVTDIIPAMPLTSIEEEFDILPSNSAPKQKIGRNEPCPCNSGRKYKKCCGRNPARS